MRHALLLFLVATAACKAPVPDKSAAAAPGTNRCNQGKTSRATNSP